MITLNKEDAFTIVDIISKAQEVIRCKDCKYYGKRFTSIIRGMHCLRYGEQMGAEDFCSRGEKKDD